LNDLEREVLEHRFALGQKRVENPDAEPMTLEQVGRMIGVAKGRVRKIQNKALQKIAHTLGSDFMI
jgi:DNA-directed RNA polymerase sigma subunit (sigma70/sigma32)